MGGVERFGVSMNAELLAAFDQRIAEAGYSNRSAAIRDVIQDYLTEAEVREPEALVVGTVMIVYDHTVWQLEDRLVQVQHDHLHAIRCTTHVHLDGHQCVEAVILTGTAAEVTAAAERLIGARGVRHGKLVMSKV